MEQGVVIVGAGQAGLVVATTLRDLGYEGPLTLIGEEAHPPYQRPPLSKAYLMGEMSVDRLYLRPLSFYEANNISLHMTKRVKEIDRVNKVVSLDGGVINYSSLVLTTGATPRRLPASIGGELEGTYVIRDLADIDRIAPEFRKNRKLVVVGGGYIGLEVAAVAIKLGLRVTLIEAAERILQRVAAPETSSYFRQLHQQHGVEILEGRNLANLTGESVVSGVLLQDGTLIDADFVVFGIGITPNIELAEKAGLVIDNGIKTDLHGRTTDASIWAAGDCASFPYNGRQIRVESVGNAIDQAKLVASNIAGIVQDYVARPWFWSDQYDVKLQICGLNTGYDNVIVRDAGGSVVSYWYYQGDTLLAVDALNDARTYMVAKRLIESGKSPDKAIIEDLTINLKSLLGK